MKESFRFKSGWYYLFFVAVMIGSLFIPFLAVSIGVEAGQDHESGLGIALVILVLWVAFAGVGGWLLGAVPSSYEADESAVTFRILFLTTRISYADIKSMEITREFQKAIIRGDIPHYEEQLHFTLHDGTEYGFQARLDLDTDEIARHPEKTAEQCEKGKLCQLYRYIESHRKGES